LSRRDHFSAETPSNAIGTLFGPLLVPMVVVGLLIFVNLSRPWSCPASSGIPLLRTRPDLRRCPTFPELVTIGARADHEPLH
jgi:hypothetical protein